MVGQARGVHGEWADGWDTETQVLAWIIHAHHGRAGHEPAAPLAEAMTGSARS